MEAELTYDQAIAALGVCRSTMKNIAKNKGLKTRYIGNAKTAKRMFKKSDIDAIAVERSGIVRRKPNFTRKKPVDRSVAISELVEWADSLTEWPSDEEINARVGGVYGVKDIESVLDTRVFRFQDPEMALRQPAMRVEDRRGRLMA